MSDLAELYETEDTALVLGDVGEILTSEKLRGLNFTVIRNVYVPTSTDGKTTEIDLIAIHNKLPNYIWVIENKNYSGRLETINVNSRYWYINYGHSINTLYNPIKQNKYHCENLAIYLSKELQGLPCLREIKLVPIVIFNDKIDMSRLHKQNNLVFKLSEIDDFVADFLVKYDSVDIDVKDIVLKLKSLSSISDEKRQQHVNALKTTSVKL